MPAGIVPCAHSTPRSSLRAAHTPDTRHTGQVTPEAMQRFTLETEQVIHTQRHTSALAAQAATKQLGKRPRGCHTQTPDAAKLHARYSVPRRPGTAALRGEPP